MNITEGSGKSSTKERGHFYEIAACSLEELHYQCLLSKDLQYIDEKTFLEAEDHIRRTSFLLTKLRQSLHA